MRARPWPTALGLRGRIVGAVLVTAVVTVAVAAVTLLGPLEHSLKSAALSTLKRELGTSSTVAFSKLDPALVVDAAIPWQLAPRQFQASEHNMERAGVGEASTIGDNLQDLAQKTSAAEIDLLSTSTPPVVMVKYPTRSTIAGYDPFRDASQAASGSRPHAVYGFGTIGGTDYVEAALAFTSRSKTGGKTRWVLAIRKKIDEIPGAVHAVSQAFLISSLAALALTLILGIPLSGTLVRRLRRLRQSALELAHEGPPVEVPVDRVRDEVGDLARAFDLMQSRLQQQEEARRAFVATASHELRTPLATLDGLLELLDDDLQSGDPDLDDAHALLERARAQSHRLGRLAADLLDLSRLDAQVELRSEPVELGELSRAVLAEFELGTAARGIATALDDHAGAVWALGDPGSVARIVRILLDNAIRMSPEGSNVTVALRNGDHASLSVSDDGPGVAPDERELIFERFMRGRATAGKAGFGLGLAIGRELATRMGGELVLEDHETPGATSDDTAGATFTLRLPVAHAPEHEPVGVG